jgi:hypothetical protein
VEKEKKPLTLVLILNFFVFFHFNIAMIIWVYYFLGIKGYIICYVS